METNSTSFTEHYGGPTSLEDVDNPLTEEEAVALYDALRLKISE